MDTVDATNRKQLGTRLAKAIEEKGLAQIEVAKAASLSKSTLSKILKGKQRASVVQLRGICAALDLSIDDFLDAPPSPSKEVTMADAAGAAPGLAAFLGEHGDRIAPAVRRHLERSRFVVDEGVVLDEDFWQEQARIWARRLGL